ncbi:B12-binding domain-containing protein [Actinomycetes bacterium NPDC127524]
MEYKNILNFTDFLIEGDQQKIMEFMETYQAKSRFDFFHDLLTPAMIEVGDRWERNEITVAEEHVASGISEFLLAHYFSLRYNTESRSRKKAMFFCLEGEQHDLGLKMVHSLFEEKGWETRYMGANLPLEYAVQMAGKYKPQVIGLSVSIIYHLPKLKNYIEELEKLTVKPKVIVGGRLCGKYDLTPYCSSDTLIVKDLTEVKDWLENARIGVS